MKLPSHTLQDNTSKQYATFSRYIVYCRKSSESDERQVQSLPDQMNTLMPFIKQRNLDILGEPFQEARSAKSPGRPLFNKMVTFIEQGQASGIILLNPSRLSRNTVDTGRIIYLMDEGKLEEVVTPFQTFKNNPYDKFMLNLLCTQAKLENDNKSVNVRDALKYKAERGEYPGKARAGYINNHNKRQGQRDISAHPMYFSLMRQIIDLALTGNYSVEALTKKAAELGIRTYTGKLMGKSSLHRYLRDPFYTGKFIYKGKLYEGKHPPMMSDEEFELLQNILDGKGKPRAQKHEVALTGLVKCGMCQYCVTVEEHTKHYKNGTSQTFSYYRCTKKSKTIHCTQPYVSAKKLEENVIEELKKFELEKEFVDWSFVALNQVYEHNQKKTEDQSKALQIALEGVNKRINNLISLKISPENSDGSLLSDSEFAERKRQFLQEKDKITLELQKVCPDENNWVDLAKESFNFAVKACQRFRNGSVEDKKVIARTVGSNLILLSQDLQIQPRYIFIKYKEGVENIKREISRLVPNNGLAQQANLSFCQKSSVM